MGYRHTIKVDKKIDEKDIDEIVKELPEKYQAIFSGIPKQEWGWPCCCDVYPPEEDTIDIGGSFSISGNICEEFINYFKDQLEKKGYIVIKVIYNW